MPVPAEPRPTGGAPAGHHRPPGETSDAFTHTPPSGSSGVHITDTPEAQALGAKESFSVMLSEEEAYPAENWLEMTKTWKRTLHWRMA